MFQSVVWPSRFIRISVQLSLIIMLGFTAMIPQGSVQAGVAAGYSEYFIPGGADQLYDILYDNQTTITDNNLHSVITIPIAVDGVTVYYDHWEDGYTTGSTPDASMETYTANRGQVLTFESPTMPANPRGTSLTACAGSTNPGGTTTRCYDGRDRIYVAGGAVAVAQAFWPSTTGTVYANAWEVYPVKPYQTHYTIPAGEDLYGAPRNYTDFQNVYVLVQATNDGTIVTIDNTNPAPGSDLTITLNKGEVTQLYNIWAGTTVSANANHPVQVQMIVGRQNGSYDSRSYTVVPSGLWDTKYYNPVSSCNGVACVGTGTANANLYIFNPSTSALSINYQDTTGSGTFIVPAGSTRSYYEMTTRYVPENSGVYLAATDGTSNFWAIGSYDTGSALRNWGFSLIPVKTLTTEYFVGWAPGTTDYTANGSPVFVTPAQDNTTIFVDYYPADGVAELTYTRNRLQVVKLRDPAGGTHPNNNTGMHVWATGPIAIVWGEDAQYSNTGNPYIDAGYTVLPLNETWIDVVISGTKTANPTTIPAAIGQVATFTIGSTSNVALDSVDVIDSLPSGWAYVNNSTTITLPDATVINGASANPVISGTGPYTLTWTNVGNSVGKPGMPAGGTLTVRFQAQTTVVPAAGPVVNNSSTVGHIGTQNFASTASATVTVLPPLDLTATKTNNTSDSGLLNIPFTWSIEVKNIGTGSTASFTSGWTILTDQLPTSGATYGAVTRTNGATPPGGTGTPSCSIAANVLACTASGGTVTLAPGASFIVSFPVTPTVTGLITNPRSGGTCSVDPNSNIAEGNETNNTCTNLVSVVAPPDLTAAKTNNVGGTVSLGDGFTWTIQVSNAANTSTASFSNGQTILTDTLPSGPAYGAITMTPVSGVTGTVACSASGTLLTCTASGPVTIASGGSFNVTVPVTPNAAGSLVNPTGGTCAVDPNGNVTEGNEGNNACTNTVSVIYPLPSISKAFAPSPILAGGTSILTFTITNPSTVYSQTNVAFTDNLPLSTGQMRVANPTGAATSGCGTPTFAPVANAMTVSFSGGTIAPGGTCTVTVNVTAPTAGTYNNTSSAVTSDYGTGNTASASLTVDSIPAATCSISMATWTFENGGTGASPTYNTKAADVAVPVATAGPGLTGAAINTGGNPGNRWQATGFASGATLTTSNNDYFQFAVDHTNYTPYRLTFDARTDSGGTGPTRMAVYYSTDGTTFNAVPAVVTVPTGFTANPMFTVDLSALTGLNYNANAVFRIYGYNASDSTNGSGRIDNISFTGCKNPASPPSISKSFNPVSIQAGGTSLLTFTITNPNAGTMLTGVSFSDVYPSGVVNQSLPGTPNTCGGTLTANVGDGGVSLVGGSILAGGSCQVKVNVTSATPATYNNTSGNVSSLNGGLGNTASATLTVSAPDILPVAVDDVDTAVENGPAVTGDVSANDTPGDPPTVVTAAAQGANPITIGAAFTTGAGGSLTLNANGTYSYAPPAWDLVPPAGLTEVFTYTITDVDGDTDTATLTITVTDLVNNPDIAIDKTPANQTVLTGSNVIFTLTVTNPGDVPLTSIIITDPACDTLTGPAGDNGDAILQTTETWTYTCTVNGVTSDFTNNASVSGTPPVGPNVTDSDSADVFVDHPAIAISKTPATQTVTSGSNVSFTLTVTNPGDVTLGSVVITDPTCDTLTGPTGDDNHNSILETTETWTYTCTVNNVTANFANIANVHGTPPIGPDVTHEDTADVIVIGPSGLTKTLVADSLLATVNPNATIGEILTYAVTVTVPAGATMPNAVLTDILDHGLAFVNCESITPSAATVTTDISGVPSSNFSPVCSTPVISAYGSADPSDEGRQMVLNFGNVANSDPVNDRTLVIRYRVVVLNIASVVEGVDLQNRAQWDWSGNTLAVDGPVVNVVEPGMSLSKTSDATILLPGGTITYTLTVGYVGAGSPVYDAVLVDHVPAGLVYVPGSFTFVSGQHPVLTDSTAPTLRANWAIFQNTGAPTLLRYQVTLGSIPNGTSVTNTASLAWTSLPGNVSTPQSPYNTYSTERFYDPGSSVNVYGTSSSAVIVVGGGGGGVIPVTGFAPGRTTMLPVQPAADAYNSLGDLWLEIPKLNVKISIIGIPVKNSTWDVTWLSNQAGYLQGTAFPTWNGNSVITAHIYLADGTPGPFVALKSLAWGDEIIIHAFGQRYVYQVRDNQRVKPDDATVFRHEEKPWVTLVTCQGYDEAKGTYLYRTAIRAVLMRVEPDTPSIRNR
jgi:LPXTG-site transpeptidase (sortase) family protein